MNIPPIIGFAGKKQSGKDTALAIVRKLYPDMEFVRLSFADSVKQEVSHATGKSLEFIEKNKDKFRPILQWWGTDFRRNMCSSDYWVSAWLKKMRYIRDNKPDCTIVATDVRFQNELDIIHTFGGRVYMIEVPGMYDLDEHESEALHLQSIDNFIKNNKTPEFIEIVKQLTEKEWK